jgi:hypothetical protein
MKRIICAIAGTLLLTVPSASSQARYGQILDPDSHYDNESPETMYVLQTLAHDEVFTNCTYRAVRVMTARELRSYADAVADPAMIAYEDSVARFKERLAGLEADIAELNADLAGLGANRARLQEDKP